MRLKSIRSPQRASILTLGVWMAALILVGMLAGPSQAVGVFKIGVFAPMTGPSAETGDGMKKASILAAEEINKKGGILGKKVVLIFGDDESKAAASASVVERMINKDKVDLLIGSMNSNVGLAVMEVAANYKVPMILTCPAAYKITEKILKDPKRYAYIIKTDPSTFGYGVTLANFLKYVEDNKLATFKKKTAVLLTQHSEWGRGIADGSKQELAKIGWKVIASEVHPHGETNFMSLISKIKALNPDILVSGETSPSSASALAKQFLQQNLQMWLMQAYAPLIPGYLEALAGKGDGILTMCIVQCHTGECTTLKQKFRQKFGNEKFDVCGGMQYDMMLMAAEAYQKAGSANKDKFMKAFLSIKKAGTVGTYVLDPKTHESLVGSGYIPPVVAQLQDGQFRFLLPPALRGNNKLQKPSWLK